MAAAAVLDTHRPLNIACVSQPDSGHMNPVMLLAEGLAERGHNVKVCTCAFGAAKYEKKAQRFGGEFVGLPCKYSEQEIMQRAEKDNTVPFQLLRELMVEPLTAALASVQLDVVVADFSTFAAMDFARARGLPLVVNLPGPASLLKIIMCPPDLERMVSFGGVAVAYTPVHPLNLAGLLNIGNVRPMIRFWREVLPEALVLVNSFWGLEESQFLLPSVVLTGPLAADPAAGLADLASSHPELDAFLRRASKVVYVTTGSMVRLQPWLVQTLYRALKLVDCSVVWSLKAEAQAHLPRQDDPQFLVSSWLPQPALLQHEKVAAVVSHCGWGGSLECIEGGKPIVALPFFGDQPSNAELLVQAGVAKVIAWPKFSVVPGGVGAYRPGSISAEAAAAAVSRVLDDEGYLRAARRLQRLSRDAGLGRAAACARVEAGVRNGLSHLVDARKMKRVTGNTPALVTLVLCGAAIACSLAVRAWRHKLGHAR